MKLNGEIVQVTKGNMYITVTMDIRRKPMPYTPSPSDLNYDDEKLGKAMELYEKQLREFNEHEDAIKSLGIRSATIEFGKED